MSYLERYILTSCLMSMFMYGLTQGSNKTSAIWILFSITSGFFWPITFLISLGFSVRKVWRKVKGSAVK